MFLSSASHLYLADPKVIPANGASHTEDNCLEELERINKEIEAVRSEVEKEQKRLSQYQTSQSLTQGDNAGLCSEKYLRTTNSQAKDQNGNNLKYKKPVSSNSGCKYVVDRARPKTDLEYDPCSNFSADLLSSSSVECKLKSTDKVDIEHSLKNDRTGKNIQHLSSHFDDSDDEGTLVIDIPPSASDQGKRRAKEKGKSTMIKPLRSPEGTCAVNNDLLANDQTKPRQHKEKVSSNGPPSHKIEHIVSNQEKERISAKPVITQEQESSEGELVIDVSSFEEQCETISKELLDLPKLCPISDAPADDGKEANEEPLNKPVSIAKHSVKETEPFLEGLKEEPVTKPVNSTNLKMEVFVTQEENVLDDISTCLDNLRSESERIKSIQDVKMLPVCSVYGNEDIYSLSPASVIQNATFKAEPQIDCISSYTQKSKIVSSTTISQEQAHQRYFPMVSSRSFPSSFHKVEEHGCSPHSQSLVETSWPTIQKSPDQPFAQNIPAYVSEIDTRTFPAPSTSQLNLKTTVDFEKLPTSDASFPVPCDIPVLPQTFASAAMTGSNNEANVVDSSSDEELRYSDLDLSETDPMEECYRIFMEANQNEAPVVQCDASVSKFIHYVILYLDLVVSDHIH